MCGVAAPNVRQPPFSLPARRGACKSPSHFSPWHLPRRCRRPPPAGPAALLSSSGEAQALLVTRQGLRPLIVDAHGSGTLSVLRTAAAPGAAYPELHVGSLFVVQRDELGTLTGAPGA